MISPHSRTTFDLTRNGVPTSTIARCHLAVTFLTEVRKIGLAGEFHPVSERPQIAAGNGAMRPIRRQSMVAESKKGRPIGRPFHCQSARGGLAKLFASTSGGAHLVRGDDPSPAIRHIRRKTMRHWITSFRMVDDESS